MGLCFYLPGPYPRSRPYKGCLLIGGDLENITEIIDRVKHQINWVHAEGELRLVSTNIRIPVSMHSSLTGAHNQDWPSAVIGRKSNGLSRLACTIRFDQACCFLKT